MGVSELSRSDSKASLEKTKEKKRILQHLHLQTLCAFLVSKYKFVTFYLCSRVSLSSHSHPHDRFYIFDHTTKNTTETTTNEYHYRPAQTNISTGVNSLSHRSTQRIPKELIKRTQLFVLVMCNTLFPISCM